MNLSEFDIKSRIKNAIGWELKDGKLTKTYKFRDFVGAILFLNKCVNPIEEYQSYPSLSVSYNLVVVSIFNTIHGGIREEELLMLEEFDRLAQ